MDRAEKNEPLGDFVREVLDRQRPYLEGMAEALVALRKSEEDEKATLERMFSGDIWAR